METRRNDKLNRLYRYMACNKKMVLECGYIRSDLKIRGASTVLFKEFFGYAASESWGENGFMGGALDKRGNNVTLDQINMDHDEWYEIDAGHTADEQNAIMACLLKVLLHPKKPSISWAIRIVRTMMDIPYSASTLRRMIDHFKANNLLLWTYARDGRSAALRLMMGGRCVQPTRLPVGWLNGIHADLINGNHAKPEV